VRPLNYSTISSFCHSHAGGNPDSYTRLICGAGTPSSPLIMTDFSQFPFIPLYYKDKYSLYMVKAGILVYI